MFSRRTLGLLVLSIAGAILVSTADAQSVRSAFERTSAFEDVSSFDLPFAFTEPDPALASPKGALWRSAAIPGWGQIYNRQYIKLPFIYGALGGLIYSAVTTHQDYILYRQAFQYKAYEEQVEAGTIDTNPKSSFKGSYDELAAEFGAISSRPLEVQRNNFRRSRDLSFVGIGLVYSLAMLDAYVSAHLLDFDVGEDLNIQVTPLSGGFRLRALVPLERRAYRGLSH
jgi:hypothetical protein